MNSRIRRLAGRYAATLRKYVAHEHEQVLEGAYELGRTAIANGLGVLDTARVHHESMEALLGAALSERRRNGALHAAQTFLLEALSPFEVTHRGFHQTNLELQQAIATLEERNRQLADMNRNLQSEIDGRKRTEQALQVSEARLQAILDHSPVVIFLKDTHGRYLVVNRQFELMFGISRDRALGRTDEELFSGDQCAAFQANDRKVMRAGVPLEFEETARYHDGVHTSIVSKFTLRDTGGKVYALCGIATDITGRKRAEEALRQSEEQSRLIFANVRDYAIFLLGSDGCVASWNASAQRIKGYQPDEIIGRHFSCFYLPGDARRGKPARHLRAALRRGRFEDEGWRVRKDGSRFWANVVIAPVRDDSGRLQGFAKVTRDATEKRQAEEVLRWSEEHYHKLFNEAQGLQEDLRNLSNQVLHVQEDERKRISRELHDEVGQMMTAISLNLEALKHSGPVGSDTFQRTILDTRNLLRQTMQTVHGFARELRPAILDELGLLPALRCFLESFAERTALRVRIHAHPSVEQLSDDQKTVLFRVAQECLTNIAKHAKARRVRVTIRKLEQGFCMEVADDGKSFDQEVVNSARAKGRLGLLGMQERLRLINGKFTIKPQPGKGTTVRVIVPHSGVEATIHENVRGLRSEQKSPRVGNPSSNNSAIYAGRNQSNAR